MITFPKKIMKTRELTEFGLALGYLRKIANKKGIAWKAGEGKTSDWLFDTDELAKQIEKDKESK